MDSGRTDNDDPDFMPALLPFGVAFSDALGTFHDAEFRCEIYGDDEPTPEELDADELFVSFARELAEGAWENRAELDEKIAPLVKGYAYERLARIDRNVLRLCARELDAIPYVPPAVTLDDWVEIAKRFSTRESGRFVNGVLSTYHKGSVKKDWSRRTAPPDPQGEAYEEIKTRRAPIPESKTVTEDSEEGKTVRRFGWILRSGDATIPPNEA